MRTFLIAVVVIIVPLMILNVAINVLVFNDQYRQVSAQISCKKVPGGDECTITVPRGE